MQKIVTIGGGTGHFQMLRGLRSLPCEITAVVNTCDNGGSSGRLRDEYGVLPPGDLRQCLVALAEEGVMLRKLFEYRFKDGHSMGNLIITALSQIAGSASKGITEAARLLRVRGKVLPVTTDVVNLCAETEKGELLEGQWKVSYPEDGFARIRRVFYKPQPQVFSGVVQALHDADKIVICPGDLYGSIVPNLIVNGMRAALKKSKATKIYVCNLFTKEGNLLFKASDFVREVEAYAGIKMEKILVNKKMPSAGVLKKYFSEHRKLVEDDLTNDPRVIRGDFAQEYLSEKKTILRHIPSEVGKVIISLEG